MYVALLIGLLVLGLAFLFGGERRSRPALKLVGGAVVAGTVVFFALLDFWGELWWYRALGFEQRFWIEIGAKIGFTLAGAAAGGAVVYALCRLSPDWRRHRMPLPALVGGVVGGLWGAAGWETILKYWNRVESGVRDPIFDKDVGFYLFTLPFYDHLYYLALALAVVALAGSLAPSLRKWGRPESRLETENDADRRRGGAAVTVSILLLAATLAWGKYLDIYHLLSSPAGVVYGAGWTDVHVRLPGYYVAIAFTLLAGLAPMVSRLRRPMLDRLRRAGIEAPRGLSLLGLCLGAVLLAWLLTLAILPGLFQWLKVEPNEITLEAPYLRHNIELTRLGFGLDDIEERHFPAAEQLTRNVIEDNRDLLSEVRLWDYRALDAVYKQFQEIRLYYEFNDVDIDRYLLEDGYRQVMVSARELEVSNLPEDSQTFVNRRFKYTHGFGLTLAPVSEFTSGGLPNLLVKNIPPEVASERLRVEQPRIYYGELTHSPVYVDTSETELDYPSGEDNAYIHYPGKGGVVLDNLWRKFVFGWMFDGTRFFVSSYPRSSSRVLFRRRVRDRIEAVAPFLTPDEDPYIALVGGRLYWIQDAYTTSRYFPYSEPYSSRELIETRPGGRGQPVFHRTVEDLDGVNYVRNSVKVVVDALDGSVVLYVYEPDDPLIRVWQRIYPDLFTPGEEMPAALRAHVRYPMDLLLCQGRVYAKYHMTDPTVFYNQEDLWVRATEKYYGDLIPVEPYYVMWRPPESDELEFILMLPFTPKNRQVMIGWIAGMSDPGNYGRLLAYKFPKERRVLGPQQVETKIDQDRYLSERLTLWDQRGSRVIRGNVLVIPIDETLLYVEPIYLQAEAAAYPELRLVVLMHEDEIHFAENLEEALRGLVGERPAAPTPTGAQVPPGGRLIDEANQAFEDYLSALGGGRFEEAARALRELQEALENLSETASSEGPPTGQP